MYLGEKRSMLLKALKRVEVVQARTQEPDLNFDIAIEAIRKLIVNFRDNRALPRGLKKQIAELYHYNREVSVKEIAERFDVCQRTVIRCAKEYGYHRYSLERALKLSKRYRAARVVAPPSE